MGGIPNNRFVIKDRREKVRLLLSQGLNETDIAERLKVSQSTICRDVRSIKKQSRVALQSIVLEVLPFEFSNCVLSMNEIIKQCWIIFEDKSNFWTNKDKINTLKLLKEAVRTKLELLLHGPVNLAISNLHEDVKRLKEDNEIPKTNFFGLPSTQRINDEDLR